MKYEILKTGSKGNCIIVENAIMLDCGVSYKSIEPYLPKIKLIFISHRHGDHLNCATIRQIAFNYPTIKYICNVYDTDLIKILVKCNVRTKNIFALKQNKEYTIGKVLVVKLQELKHDVFNSACEIRYKGKRLIYITDTGNVDNIDAKGFDYYLIEANYKDEEELDKLIKKDYDEGKKFSHYERVRDTHLSQEQAIKFLKENMKDYSIFEFIHGHELEEKK